MHPKFSSFANFRCICKVAILDTKEKGHFLSDFEKYLRDFAPGSYPLAREGGGARTQSCAVNFRDKTTNQRRGMSLQEKLHNLQPSKSINFSGLS
jgi:hypothetical protein